MKEVNEDGHQEPIGAHEVIHGRPITSSTGTVTGRGSGEATLKRRPGGAVGLDLVRP